VWVLAENTARNQSSISAKNGSVAAIAAHRRRHQWLDVMLAAASFFAEREVGRS
jgi:hypothetical protein